MPLKSLRALASFLALVCFLYYGYDMTNSKTTIRADAVVVGTMIRAGYAGQKPYAVKVEEVRKVGAQLVLKGSADADPGSPQVFMVDPAEVLFLA